MVNIPQEAFDRLGIDLKDIDDKFSPGVRSWFIEQAELGLSLLDQQEKIFKEDNLPWLAKVLVPHLYIKPARRYFQAVLKGEK